MAFDSKYSGTFGGSKGFTLNRVDTENDSFDGSRVNTRLGLSGNVDLN